MSPLIVSSDPVVLLTSYCLFKFQDFSPILWLFLLFLFGSSSHIFLRIVVFFLKFSCMFLAYYELLDFLLGFCFPGGSDGKASSCSAGDPGLIPGLGRSRGEGNGNPLQYSCLENSMD